MQADILIVLFRVIVRTGISYCPIYGFCAISTAVSAQPKNSPMAAQTFIQKPEQEARWQKMKKKEIYIYILMLHKLGE